MCRLRSYVDKQECMVYRGKNKQEYRLVRDTGNYEYTVGLIEIHISKGTDYDEMQEDYTFRRDTEKQ